MSGLFGEEKKEVVITIGGLHNDQNGEADDIQLVSVGEHYFRNGKHYLVYEDMPDAESGEVVQNTMKLSREETVLTKRKAVSAQMIFRPGSRSEAFYRTPVGMLHIGLSTSEILLEEKEQELHAEIGYDMDVNGEAFSSSRIIIDVRENSPLS